MIYGRHLQFLLPQAKVKEDRRPPQAFEFYISLHEMVRKVIRKEMCAIETRESLDVIDKKGHGGTESRFFAYRKIYNDFPDKLTNVNFGKFYKIRRPRLETLDMMICKWIETVKICLLSFVCYSTFVMTKGVR